MAATGGEHNNYARDNASTSVAGSHPLKSWTSEPAPVNTLVPIPDGIVGIDGPDSSSVNPLATTASQSDPLLSMVSAPQVTSMGTTQNVPAMSFGSLINTPISAQLTPSLLTATEGGNVPVSLVNSHAQEANRGTHEIPANNQRGVGEMGAASSLYMLSKVNGERKDGHKTKDEHEFDDTTQKTNGRADDGDQNDPESLKRRNFLERNRQAALKCRQRKKAWLASLQAKVEYLQSDNESLQSTVEMLRSEVLYLKSQLMQQGKQQQAQQTHTRQAQSQSRAQQQSQQQTQQQQPGPLDIDAKDSNEMSRSIAKTFGPVSMGIPGGFVGYASQPPTSHALMSSIPTTSMSASAAQPHTIDNDSPAPVAMSGYGQPGLPRLTQMPVQSSLLPQYASQHHAYPTNRGSG